MTYTLQNKITLVIFSILGLLMSSMQAQEAKVYSWFDEVVGPSNTMLFNGVGYIEAHRTINENHKFFLSNNFIEGTLFYDGQPYFSQLLKYNVFDEVLLIQAQDGLNQSLFQLIKEKIDGFTIGGHVFTNIRKAENNSVNGFYEVLEQNEQVQLLKKHSRNINQLIENRIVYYEFKPKDMGYLLKYKDNYYDFNSRRDVLRIFPEARREIQEHFSSARNLQRTDRDRFMVNLLGKISPVIQQNNKGI